MMFVSASINDIVDNIVFSGLIILISIFFSQVVNSVIKPQKRLSRKILWKSNLFALAISYGVWILLIFVLGLTINRFIPMQLHVFLVAFFFGVKWFFGKKFTTDEIKHSLIGLEERLKEKEVKLRIGEPKIKEEEILLDVQDLITYFYTEEGIVKAVEGVTFQIYEDEVLGLVGETGCGKSVTALSVLQLIRPPGEIVGGKVLFQGTDLLQKSSEEMQKYRGDQITMIFQDPLNSLNPVMKVGDQIIEVYLNHKMDELYADAGQFVEEADILKAKLNSKKDTIKATRKKELETVKTKFPKLNNVVNVGQYILMLSIVPFIFGLIFLVHPFWEYFILWQPILICLGLLTFGIGKASMIMAVSFQSESLKILKREYTDLKAKAGIFMVARDWAAKVIRDVGIADPKKVLDRYPHELSGGMRQRIMIAIALSCSPKLLIADEPTTALDVTIQAQILELMKRLQKEYNTSILMITHDLGLISELCDRVAVMYSGYIVEYGSIYKLFKNPLHPYTHGLIRAIPRVEKKVDNLAIIPGMVPNLIYPPSGCRFHPRCEYCFEPCDSLNPKQIEAEPGYFVACHLFDPEYKAKAEIALKNPMQIEEEGV